MYWKDVAESDLRRLSALRKAADSLAERKEMIEARLDGLKGIQFRAAPTPTGSSCMEDQLLNGIVDRDETERQLENTMRTIRWIEKGLANLSPEERLVLDYFYIDRRRNHVEELSERLHVSQPEVYRLRNAALYRYITLCYGLLES